MSEDLLELLKGGVAAYDTPQAEEDIAAFWRRVRGAIARAEAGVVKNGGSCVVFRAMARLAAQDRWRQP